MCMVTVGVANNYAVEGSTSLDINKGDCLESPSYQIVGGKSKEELHDQGVTFVANSTVHHYSLHCSIKQADCGLLLVRLCKLQ